MITRKYVDAVYENPDWWFALETYSRDYQRFYLRATQEDAA